MWSSVAVRAQVASIIDALSKAAVAEIAKVVEDGMVVLRLELCQRENEIKKLKSNIELLHTELRSAQERASLHPDSRGRDDCQSHVGDESTLLEKVLTDEDQSRSVSEVQVKCEPVEDGDEEPRGQPDQPTLYDRDAAQWRPTTQTHTGGNDSDYLHLGQNSLCLPESSLDTRLAAPCSSSGGFQHGPYGRGLLGSCQYRNSYNAVRRRTVKRLIFKKGFICSYCGKCFERAGHLERHKRIHTGEKPYRCEICGRRFNQNCSLKEHMKIHRRCIQPRPVDIQAADQNQILEANPCTETHQPQEESRGKAEDGLPETEDVLPTAAHVKSEPAEENVTHPLFHGGSEQAVGGVDALSENFATFERDSQQWMCRLQGQSNADVSSAEYLGTSEQSMASFPSFPPPVEASCSTFSFPGKPYTELKNSMISQTPYGSTDTLMLSSEAGLHGMARAPPNHHKQRASRSFQVIKPKKFFVCSYCCKVFERHGHLERHLRIHTGEKPYGCQVCGRCFNQKSSLKGHMKTHRNGENTDVLDAHQLMFSMPDNQQLKNPAEPDNGLTALEEHLPGPAYGDPAGEQTVTVKLNEARTENGTGAPDQSQLWTSGIEKNCNSDTNMCVLLPDVKYPLSPAAEASSEQQGYTSPIKDLPFLDHKDDEELMTSNQYSMIGMQPTSSDMTLAPELQEQHLTPHVSVNDYTAAGDRIQEGAVFEFNLTASGGRGDSCGEDATRQNCFICSTCGQGFDSFSLFQSHQCKDIPEKSFGCHICGKMFNQMSALKVHLKLHVE